MVAFQAATAPRPAPSRRDASRSASFVWLENAFRRCRVVYELGGGPNRAAHQFAAAVRAPSAGQPIGRARRTEGAFERADQRVRRVWRQVPVAAFAVGSERQHDALPYFLPRSGAIFWQASTSALTALADFSNSLRSEPFSSSSTMRSTPFAPMTTGTPT